MKEKMCIRRFQNGDEAEVSDVICTTLSISNRNDYPPEFIQENIESHSPEVIKERADEYFKRAWRTEIGSSLTAVEFYRKLGYQYKNNITSPDEYGVVRLEKITGSQPGETKE